MINYGVAKMKIFGGRINPMLYDHGNSRIRNGYVNTLRRMRPQENGNRDEEKYADAPAEILHNSTSFLLT